MKWCIILISTLAVIQSRPHDTPAQHTEPAVELEKQTLVEVTPNLKKYVDQFPHPTQRKMEDNTKEILEKIAAVNKRHGLVSRREKPNYFHFPFSYSRSQEQEHFNKERTYTSSPFSNPILEYLLATKDSDEEEQTKKHSFHNDSDDSDVSYDYDDEIQGDEKTISRSGVPGITKEDVVPGQYIKRKVVHQQTFAIPMYQSQPNFMAPQNMPPNFMPSPNMPLNIPVMGNFPQPVPTQSPSISENKDKTKTTGDKKVLSSLEKQTVDNVRNIVSNTQMQAYPYMYNPYMQYPQENADQYQYNGYVTPNRDFTDQSNSNDEYSYRIYGPYPIQNSGKGRQNWNWPGANYFPIYIRDPFLQFYNAITSMVEYGPTAGQGGPCKSPPKRKGKDEHAVREIKPPSKEREQIVVEMGDKTTGQITIYGNDEEDSNSSSYLDIENIDIGGNGEGGLKFTVSLAPNEREAKGSEERVALKTVWDKTKGAIKSAEIYNSSRSSSKFEKFSESSKDVRPTSFIKPQVKPLNAAPAKQPTQSPPIRDPTIQVEEVDDEFDDNEKSEDVSISNDGNKKMFSRDNTGSGIFIHKLKVRKGGVAIAGPGGIATAGSGGTAIVGPNGVAFTQPDSLAIAGSGTKVVAVDPTINLGDLINSTSLINRTSSEGFPPSRVGKVVAVGPVIYYNKGKSEKVTVIPFYGGGKGQALQIVESSDGQVTTTIIKIPDNYSENFEESINTAELENPPLPSKYELDEFGNYVRNIKTTALKVIKLQEIAKRNGKLSEEEEALYKESMESLNQSARNLARIQEEANPLDFESREGLSAWFERKQSSNKDKNKRKEEDDKKKKEEEKKRKEEERKRIEESKKREEEKKKEEERKKEEQKRKEEERRREEERKEEEKQNEDDDDDDSITINLPPEDASVAEAKPVGLAVAGAGGVAASKPIATAVVGPGGLAIARPIGTAIAGVSPEQALVPIYAEAYMAGSRPKTGSTATNKQDTANEFINRLISKYHQN